MEGLGGWGRDYFVENLNVGAEGGFGGFLISRYTIIFPLLNLHSPPLHPLHE